MNIRNFFTKAITILLVCVMVFIGISNLLSEGNETDVVAKVGKEIISLNEYKSLYKNYSGNFENQKKLKYDLLSTLVEQKLLINLVSDLGLKIGEDSIKDHIKNTKYFQNEKGEFNREKFYEVLHKMNITEKEYVARLKKVLPAIMLMNSLIFKENYPVTFGEEIDGEIYKNRHQTRVVDIVKVTKDAVTNIPEPDNQDLLSFYEKNKSNFYYPEYRTAQYMSVGLKYFEDQIEITNEEVDSIIEKQSLKNQIDILNLILNSKEEAEEMRKAILNKELTFEQQKDIRVNNVTRDFLPEDMREKVFSLKEGEISEVFESSFGWHLIRVENIHQISDEDLTNLRKDIKLSLINQKSFQKINDFINQVNYKIYNGASVEDISNEYNLPIHTVGPMDINGKGQDGSQVLKSNTLSSFIFSRDKNQKSYFKGVDDVIVSVKIIDSIPSKLQSFEDSRSSVLELWRNEFITQEMFKIATSVANKLKEGKNVNNTQGIELIRKQKINNNNQNYPSSFIKEIFNTKTINLITTPTMHENAVIVGLLKESYSSSGKLDTIESGQRVMMSLKEQLISYLESKYKIEVNHSILEESV
ncbi:MAG: SurA N-terminal domain-containing protein [Wolbachia endosymbiont of Fragariocoptes setiger]|nr:SurA N-terminal domain-containing protein [Wolbachia endosymbiont of Fragariocoptes setiger]